MHSQVECTISMGYSQVRNPRPPSIFKTTEEPKKLHFENLKALHKAVFEAPKAWQDQFTPA